MSQLLIEIERRQKGCTYPVLICPSHVPELLELKLIDEGLLVGGSVTLSNLKDFITTAITELPSHTTGVLQAVLNMLKWFAGAQIRNVSVSILKFIICVAYELIKLLINDGIDTMMMVCHFM